MSFYDDASLVFLAGGAAGKDGKAYNLKPYPNPVSGELITNGGFDADSDWNKVGESTISGGKGNIISTAGVWSNLNQTNVFTVGRHYRLSLDATVNINAADYAIKLQDGSVDVGYITTSGSYVFYFTSGGTTLTIARYSTGSAVDVDIDNVSVVEVDKFPADFTFTRGTNLTATRVGKDGYIEKGRENLLKYSNTFNQTGNALTGWNLTANNSGTAPTVTSGQSGYDGSTNAWLLDSENEVNNYCRLEQNPTYSGVFTFSIYAKSGTADFLVFENGGIANDQVYFDLASGDIESEDSGVIDAKITAITGSAGDTNRWYRCSVTLSGTSNAQRVYASTSGTDVNSGTAGNIYIQDAQLEAGLVATDYIETGATTATSGLLEDEPRFDYTGGGCPALLLEPSRTNLVDYSDYFGAWNTRGTASVTDNQAVSPEGVSNAALLDFGSTTSGANRIDLQPAISSGTDYLFSVFVKNIDANRIGIRNYNTTNDAVATFDFSSGSFSYTNINVIDTIVESYSNGWYRIGIVSNSGADTSADVRINPDTTSGSDGEQIYIYGAQLEKGSYPTSYIPTYGSAATRSKEGASDSYDYMNLSATNLYSSTSYTYFLDINLPYDVGTSGSLWKDNDSLSANGGFQLRKTSDAGTHVGITTHDGSSYEAFSTNVLTGRLKLAIVYNNGEVSVYYNGVESAESPMTVTGWDQSTNHFKFEDGGNGTYEVQQFLYIPTALSNNDCEILTGTSYTSFASMASTLSYTQYE